MFHSLKITLLLSHTGIILLTNLLLAYVSYFYLIDSLEKRQQEHLEFIVHHAVESVNGYIRSKSETLERISEGPEVVKYTVNYREAALAAYLAAFHNSFPDISFINGQGVEEVRVADGEITQNVNNYKASHFFDRTMGQPNKILLFSDAALPGKGPALQLAIAKYQYFEDRFVGLLLASLPYEKIAESLADIKVGVDGYLKVHDNWGNVLTIVPPHRRGPGDAIATVSRQTDADVPAALGSGPGTAQGAIFQKAMMRGREAFIASTFMADPQWTIIAVLPHEEFMEQVQRLRVGFIVLFAIFFALASLLSYMLANGITMPLSRLTRAARAVSQGNLREIIDIKSRDEIGRLIGSFNTMTRNLQQTTISRDYFNTILSSMQESLIVLGPDGTIETINRATSTMLGYEKDELSGKHIEFILKKTESTEDCPFDTLAQGEILRECELIYRTRWGKEIPVLFSASPMRNSNGEMYGIVCLAINIARRKKTEEALRQSEAKLREIAITDELTGLLNRRGFMTMAVRQLQVAKRQEENIFLMFADVDNLKWVNDHLGHHAGDQVLIETADILRHTFRDSDIIARLGGDEFAILLIDPTDEKTVISRLERNMATRNQIAGRLYELSMSIGVVRYDPEHPASIEEMMNQADTLMYDRKQKKKQGNG
jgi:diguanylate cyclase (GGDEF)-like protein/PAS domain S-box-containing protein